MAKINLVGCIIYVYIYFALNRYRLQENNSNYTINAANRVYVQNGLPLKDCLQTVFSKEMKAVDFRQVWL